MALAAHERNRKFEKFRELHHGEDLLVLPNIWDPFGAMMLQSLGYPAVATASASIAFSNGYDDGEKISFADVLRILTRIAGNVKVPVTADMESGYASSESGLKENIGRLLETGVVGINFEDTDKKTNKLIPLEEQCERIRIIKDHSEALGLPLFVNARTDVYVREMASESTDKKLDEVIRRGLAFKAAGADSFFPLAMTGIDEIKIACDKISMPLNILLIPGVPELQELRKTGVTRVSLGPGFLKIAVKALKKLAEKLQSGDGLADITGNEITSEYLKKTVIKME